MSNVKFTVEFSRGPDGPYIVNVNGSYYLVSIETEAVTKAAPPDIPDMFLKFGYFEQVDNWPLLVNSKIRDILYANNLLF